MPALAVRGLCEEERRLAVTIVHSDRVTGEETQVQRRAVTCSDLLSQCGLSQTLLPGLPI